MAQREVALGDMVLEIPGLWKNPRSVTGLDKQSIAELSEDIKHRNIVDPLTVQRVRVTGSDGVITLILDGQRRVLAASKAGCKPDHKILVVDARDEIIELTVKSAAAMLLDVLAQGTFREGISSFEQSEAAERLKAAGNSLGEIGKAIKRSDSWVSRILSARKTATPELMQSWRDGKVTDEQFKDLAAVKHPSQQQEALTDVVEVLEKKATASGAEKREIASETRQKLKDLAATHRTQSRAEKKVAPRTERRRDLKARKLAAKEVATERKAPSRAVLQELVDLTKHRTPTADLVKGIMLGVRYALGELDTSSFGKPWKVFMALISNSAKKSEPTTEKAEKKAKPVSKKEQRKRDRAQVRTATKKSKK